MSFASKIRFKESEVQLGKKAKRIEQKQAELQQAKSRLTKQAPVKMKPKTPAAPPHGCTVTVLNSAGQCVGYMRAPHSALTSHPTMGRSKLASHESAKKVLIPVK